MNLISLLTIMSVAWVAWMVYAQFRVSSREMSRLHGGQTTVVDGLAKQFDTLASSLAVKNQKKQTLGYHASKSDKEMAKKLADAGLETAAAQGRFLFLRMVSCLTGPAIGAIAYIYILPYYATLLTLTTSVIGLLVPMFWLKKKAANRTEDIQRELPLVLDLTNLGTSAGWDVAAALERVIDSLYPEFPNHPLIKELKRARWLTASGYTWEEALTRLSNKLNEDTLRRTTLALGQAIKQGGDRTKQLEGIAEDAQRIYYAQLDKRLAALPMKALLATMLLMIAYFVILLAPAIVQVKNTL